MAFGSEEYERGRKTGRVNCFFLHNQKKKKKRILEVCGECKGLYLDPEVTMWRDIRE